MVSSEHCAGFWKVVGGGEKGGIVVRANEDVATGAKSTVVGRLSTGAVVEEVDLVDGRLRFRKLSGVGPESGWVSLKLANGKDLLSKIQLWKVTGGAEKGGIIVREGFNVTSAESSRLATGSTIQEMEVVNERLRYQLVTGTGPELGWVSIVVQKKPLLCKLGAPSAPELQVRFLLALRQLDDIAFQESLQLFRQMSCEEQITSVAEIEAFWETADFRLKRKSLRCLTGSLGATMETASNLILRASQDTDATVRGEAVLVLSAPHVLPGLEKHDAFGEVLRKVFLKALEDENWRVRRAAAGALRDAPDFTSQSDFQDSILARAKEEKDVDVQKLLNKLSEHPENSVSVMPSLQVSEQIDPSKLRIMAVHGASSNSAIMRFQVRLLKAALEKTKESHRTFEIEWLFVDSPIIWTPVLGATDPIFGEPGDFEKSLSKGQPFRCWYSHGSACYNDVDHGVSSLLELIKRQHVDVVVSFSQASNCISMLLDSLRRMSEGVPWKLSVMFSGGQIDDPLFQWPKGCTSEHPTLRVFNAARDDFFEGSESSLKQMYPEILEFSHSDGHMFPHSQPRASEIYQKISQEIYMRLLGEKVSSQSLSGPSFLRLLWVNILLGDLRKSFLGKDFRWVVDRLPFS